MNSWHWNAKLHIFKRKARSGKFVKCCIKNNLRITVDTPGVLLRETMLRCNVPILIKLYQHNFQLLIKFAREVAKFLSSF